MTWFVRLNDWLEGRRLLSYLLLFLICLTFFSWLQYFPSFGDPDAYYHIGVVQLMNEGGVVQDFPQLPFTVLGEGYVDHHFVYHLILMPFVYLVPALIGAKLAHVLLASLVMVMFFWLLNKLTVRGAFFYSLLPLLCGSFIFRMVLVKAQPVSIIILFLGLYLIMAGRYRWLIPLSFIYVWAYNGWFLMLVLVVVYILVNSLELTWREKESWLGQVIFFLRRKNKVVVFLDVWVKNIFSRLHLKLGLSVVAGLMLGIIINPYFPKNLRFYWVHIFKIGLENLQDVIGVGAEWYPYSIGGFLEAVAIPLILLCVATVFFLHYRRQLGTPAKFLFWVMVLFWLATMKSRRNIEYLIPLTILFSAVALTAVFRLRQARKDIKSIYDRLENFWYGIYWLKIFLIVVALGAVAFLAFISLSATHQSLGGRFQFSYLEEASNFLSQNAEPGEVIFHSDWDDFPSLFFHNKNNAYIIGMDPTFMYLYNSDLYWQWHDITRGKRYGEMYDIIKNSFGAGYVMADHDNKDMVNNLDRNFYFKKVYEDNDVLIYEVL